MSCSQGALARLLVEPGASPHAFDSSSEATEFRQESVTKKVRWVHPNGIRGTRQRHSIRARKGAYEVGGLLQLSADPKMLDLWLPRCLGGTLSSGSVPLAESLPTFGMLLDRKGSIFEYSDCLVNQWSLRGQAGPGDGQPELVDLVTDIWALDEAGGQAWPGSPPSLSTAANTTPYIVSDAAFTFAGNSHNVIAFSISGNNFLQRKWSSGSLTAVEMCPEDLELTMRIRTYFSSDEYTDLYDPAASITAAVTLTNGTVSMSFTAAAMLISHGSDTGRGASGEGAVVKGKREIEFEFEGEAMMTGATSAWVTTNDSTV